mmetsp:Transcript_15787/g.37734  ORF Transcript_15787/g.37734 Transcript_15787/m.37734 type:complete len:676 (-) Transcript_15787:107-2134(-)
MDDVRHNAVKEARVVGDDERGDLGLADEEVLEPRNVLDVQMVGRLVEEEDVGVHEDGAAQCELHLPPARQTRHVALAPRGGGLVVDEAELVELLLDDVAVHVRHHRAHVVDDRHLGLVALDVVLDVHRLEHVRRREVVDLPVGDGAHERRLAAAVVAAHTVAHAALQVEARVVEEDLGAVAERELAVAEVLALVVVVLGNVLGHRLLEAAREQRLAQRRRVALRHEGREERAHRHELPLELVEEEVVDHRRDGARDVLDEGREGRVRHGRVGRGGRGDLEDRGEADVRRHRLGGLVLGDGGLDVGQRLERLVAHGARLRVRNLLGQALDLGHEGGEEGLGLLRLVNELRHVVDNHRHLALDLRLLLLAAAQQDGDGDGERGRVNRLHEHSRRELVHRLRDLIWVLDGADERGDEGLDVPVGDRVAALGHAVGRRVLDVRLGVPHGLRHHRHRLRQAPRKRLRHLLRNAPNRLARHRLDLPLGLLHALVEHAQDRAAAPRADVLANVADRPLGSGADFSLLVGDVLEQLRQKGHDERLGESVASGGEGSDNGVRVLLRRRVRQELLQRVHCTGLDERTRASLLHGLSHVVGGENSHVVGQLRREGRHGLLDSANVLDVNLVEVDLAERNIVERVRLLKRLFLFTSCRHFYFCVVERALTATISGSSTSALEQVQAR